MADSEAFRRGQDSVPGWLASQAEAMREVVEAEYGAKFDRIEFFKGFLRGLALSLYSIVEEEAKAQALAAAAKAPSH